MRTAYTFSTPVNYCALSFRSPDLEDEITGPLRILLSLLSRSSLWALEREKGGAYGSGASLDINEEICYFYTYRDPRLDDSVFDFMRSVKEETLTQEKLEDTMLRVLSKDVRPTGPQSRGLVDLRRYLYEIPDEMRKRLKDAMLSSSLEDLEKAREKLLSLMAGEAALTVLSSTRSAKKSREKFTLIKLPFSHK